MSTYLTEEEQLQALKNWWQRHSNIILTVVSIILLIAAGYRYWNWYQEKQTTLASTAYEQLMVAFSNKDNKSIKSYANQLIQNYPNTVYADASHLILAKLYIAKDKYDAAKKELSMVAEQSKMPALKQVAKIRLARILTSNKAWGDALKTLEKVDDKAYLLLINELKGDIYAMKGDYPKALDYYKMAINDAKNSNVGDGLLEMKTSELATLIESSNGKDNHS